MSFWMVGLGQAYDGQWLKAGAFVGGVVFISAAREPFRAAGFVFL
jgi:hypothetical protein